MTLFFSYKNLLFDQTINVYNELELSQAIFVNKQINAQKIYSHCEKSVSKCKNQYYFHCFITSRTDDFGNVMTYYLGETILIVKCVKPSNPIPVLITFEIKLPHNILFVIKLETKQPNYTLDLLSFANDFLANPNMMFHMDLEQITETLNSIGSEEEYNDFVEMFTSQIDQVKDNKKVIDHYLKICGKSDLDFNPYTDVYSLLYKLHILSNKLNNTLKKLNSEFGELKKSHDAIMAKLDM